VVVSAVGTLDRPFVPDIEGSDTFEGKTFHSARWDDTLNASGKHIVVLGNGASATQFVPELVKEVGPKGSVNQFVRSAHWWTKRVGWLSLLRCSCAKSSSRETRSTQKPSKC
jgi:cation diffusion facilitator CzcD-associated flavoprotein CzcO